MIADKEICSNRTIHVQTLHPYGERNSLVRVNRADYELQFEYVRAKHMDFFRLKDYLEIILNPVEHNEADLMRSCGVLVA